jgi:hypothetical protein
LKGPCKSDRHPSPFSLEFGEWTAGGGNGLRRKGGKKGQGQDRVLRVKEKIGNDDFSRSG